VICSQPLRRIIAPLGVALSAAACATEAPLQSSFALVETGRGVEESADPGRPLIVRSGPRGQLYVATQRLSNLVQALDSSVRFIRTIGRPGPGPGEFGSVGMLYPKGDSVVVGDTRGDAAVFGPDGGFVRSLRIHIRTIGQVLNLRGDSVLVPTPVMSKERFGLPLQLLGPDGDTVRSFGSADRSFDGRVLSRLYRHVAPATDSTFWVGRVDQYVVERWHMNGTLLQTLTMKRPWFPPLVKDWDGTNAERFPTMLKQVHQDHDGHLLVMLERARPDWSASERGGHLESGKLVSLLDRLAYEEQIIEVLDAKSGTLISTINNQGSFLLNFVDDDRVIGITQGAEGREVLVVYRVSHPTINH